MRTRGKALGPGAPHPVRPWRCCQSRWGTGSAVPQGLRDKLIKSRQANPGAAGPREGGAWTARLESAAWTQCHPPVSFLPPPRPLQPAPDRPGRGGPGPAHADARGPGPGECPPLPGDPQGPSHARQPSASRAHLSGRLAATDQVKRIVWWCVKGDQMTGSGRGPVTSGLFLPQFLGWYLQLWPAESEGGVGVSARAFWRACKRQERAS